MQEGWNIDPNSDEINLRDLFLPIWIARKQVIIISLICGFFGAILGFMTPVSYTASSTFLPQTSQEGGGNLGGLAALAGINLNTGAGNGGEISPSLYVTVIASSPFQKRILDSKISLGGKLFTYREYLANQPSSSISALKKYTIGLPGTIISFFSDAKPDFSPVSDSTGLVSLDDNEYGIRNSLEGKIKLIFDENEGFVSLSVEEGDPLIAAQVAKLTEKVLQDWIIENKIKNAKAQYDFIENQFQEKQKEFFSIQEELANYMDRNQNVLSATYLTRLNRIQAEYDLVNTIYSELAKQKEQAAIQLSKETPTFTILNPVEIPKEKTGPNKKVYFFGSFFAGLVGAALWYLVRKPIHEFLNGLKEMSKTNSLE
jgi:uncharacterized protein involved in exopolysaccharide biosynthesis